MDRHRRRPGPLYCVLHLQPRGDDGAGLDLDLAHALSDELGDELAEGLVESGAMALEQRPPRARRQGAGA